ncbi:hypothetical protein [Micromonospora arida]|uniref:hypothetical protein n=1 Tax=Micromonospora arida TaxID=2203715 RepID=UPI000F5F3E5F|nr:hypothetical protein [Micromonospora arida]
MRTRTLRGAVVAALNTGAVASALVLSAAPAAAYLSNCGAVLTDGAAVIGSNGQALDRVC